MRNIKYSLTIILIISQVILSSCEGVQKSNGIVVDDITGNKLDSVFVSSYAKKKGKGSNLIDEMVTDKQGIWTATTMMQGCIPRCPDLVVTFSRTGYQTITLTNPKAGTEVRMTK